jgi:hypothetical protein
MTIKTTHKWAHTLVHQSFDEFIDDGRGGKHTDRFWDVYPDLKLEVKHLIAQECSKRKLLSPLPH